MYVRVSIQAHQEDTGLLVPVSAVLRDDVNLPFVYFAQPDGSFARQHVTLGYRAGDRYHIAEGLKVGDQIVVDGASLFSSCKINERRSKPNRRRAAISVVHESDRDIIAASGISGHPDDARADWRRGRARWTVCRLTPTPTCLLPSLS